MGERRPPDPPDPPTAQRTLSGFFLRHEPEIRAIIRRIARLRPDSSLQVTDVLDESYLRMRRGKAPRFRDPGHFLAYYSHVVRSVMRDRARRKGAIRRGGLARHTTMKDVLPDRITGLERLAIHDLLQRYRASGPEGERGCQVIVLSLWHGLTDAEIAVRLGVSTRTVERSRRAALAWLLKHGGGTA